jgi:FkbM family methyltransferase
VNDQYFAELDTLLSEPIASVRERERFAFERLLSGCGGRTVLFGAGNLGRKVLESLRGIGVEPLAFADNGRSKWGSRVDGIPVLSPKDAAERYGSSALFIVSIWSLGQFYPESRATLQRMGCAHITSTTFLRWKFADRFLPDFCLDLPHKVYNEATEVRRAASLWADDFSRQEYLRHVRWRALGDQECLTPPVAEESYFLDSLYKLRDREVFIDCGAYTGDTAERVVERSPGFLRIVAIEADPANFGRLTKWAANLEPGIASRIDCLNVAVGAKRDKLHFAASGDEGAHIAKDGDLEVDCVPLDELLGDSMPTFIKMDIEGAEIEALEGSKRTIQKSEPILSVCVYHKQNDLWRVPLLIHSLADDYRLFLRPHDVDGWQLVCYAVPPNRLIGKV